MTFQWKYKFRRRSPGDQALEHTLVVERILGGRLPERAVIHHVNHDGHDNRPENLVVCPDHAYHAMLHRRERALDACGHADWRFCTFCKAYSPPAQVTVSKYGQVYHKACKAKHEAARTTKNRSAHSEH